MFTKGLALLGTALPALTNSLDSRQSELLDTCPGYTASNVKNDGSTVTADLTLAGTACNAYGKDLSDLKLLVEYQTGMWYLSETIPVTKANSCRTTTSRQDL
jgi:alpha-glucosidase